MMSDELSALLRATRNHHERQAAAHLYVLWNLDYRLPNVRSEEYSKFVSLIEELNVLLETDIKI